MSLTIRFQGGPRAGETLQFDQETVLFGRAEGCHVRFAADQTKVSSQHCAIVRRMGEYRLEIAKDDLVLLGGQRASDGDRLKGALDLQLGPGGPELVLTVANTFGGADTALPMTEAQGDAAPSTRAALGQHVAASGRNARLLLVAVAALTLLGFGLHARLTATAADAATLDSRLAQFEQRVTTVESGERALSESVAQASSRRRARRMPAAGAPRSRPSPARPRT